MIAVLLFFVSSIAQAASGNGVLLEEQPLKLSATYQEWFARAYNPAYADPLDPPADLQAARAYYTPERYQALDGTADVSVERIVYASDGLRIRGFRIEPRQHEGRLPVIVWCRGGLGDTGMILTGDLMIMTNWARRGFLVLSTQYRGSSGSEGKDEDGGADVHDVLALFDTVRLLPEADPQNIFLYGLSRGGMMVYQAMRAGAPVRAAAVNSAVSDAAGYHGRPDAQAMEAMMRKAIPRFHTEKQAGFPSRSAVDWAGDLHAPLLLLHGTADWRVKPAQTLRMAAALDKAGRPYELHLFEQGGHVVLSGDQQALDREILDFSRSTC